MRLRQLCQSNPILIHPYRLARAVKHVLMAPLRLPVCLAFSVTRPDRARLRRAAWVRRRPSRESALADIVMNYHVLEKGLTMPARRKNFGHAAILQLAAKAGQFLKTYGEAPQVLHAIGCLRAYDALHDHADHAADPTFWNAFDDALARLPQTPPATQPHTTREAFFAASQAPFEAFARSRHTLRHYAGPLPIERVRAAVALAVDTAPSACNRQFTRVRCVSDHAVIAKLLEIQGGSRGFGHLADKLLVITADLDDAFSGGERNEPYVEGGILLMNLAYALHCHRIAHCILNCFFDTPRDNAFRALLPGLPQTELLIAAIACGEAPAEFDVAASPRRPLSEVYAEL